jgi:hypothetical protein
MTANSRFYGAIGVSTWAHVILGLSLALCVTPPPRAITERPVLIASSDSVEEPLVETSVSLLEITQFDDEKTSLAISSSEDLAGERSDVLVASLEVRVIPDSIPDSTLALAVEPSLLDADETVAVESTSPLPRQPGGVVAAKDAGAVIDRLTAEIAKHAVEKETTVYWLLDASLSVAKQRLELAERLHGIALQLRLDPSASGVKHAIYSFGQSCEKATDIPTDDPATLSDSVRAIKLDESGVENVFTAVESIIKGPIAKSTGSSVIMVVTDEVGDDQGLVGSVAELARRKAVTVYVIGSPSPFGQGRCQFKFVDPDPAFDQSERMAEVEQGPESFQKMTLDIATLPIDYTALDSGFGPYALTLLCHESGGLYFATHPNRRVDRGVPLAEISPMASAIQQFFEPDVMRRYRPEYALPVVLTREIVKQPAKRALIAACSQPRVEVRLPSRQRFPVASQEVLQRRFSAAQKEVARSLVAVDGLCGILDTTEAIKSSAALSTEPRWDASFSLALGRALATKARLDGWNEMLGGAKEGLKAKDPQTNVWVIEPSKDLTRLSSKTKQVAERAIKTLRGVVDAHPGTPWAAVACAELAVPLAYEWKEVYEPPPKPPQETTAAKPPRPAPPTATRPPPDEQPRRIAPKQARGIQKI